MAVARAESASTPRKRTGAISIEEVDSNGIEAASEGMNVKVDLL